MAKVKAKVVAHPSAKNNSGVRGAEEKMSANENMLRRVCKRLDINYGKVGKEQAEIIVQAVIASLQETTVVKGSISLPIFAKFEVVTKKASSGTIQFGERKGETWEKPEHQAIKISNINGVWGEKANDDADVLAIDDIESLWGAGNADVEADEDDVDDVEADEDDEADEVEDEAPAKKAPAKKALAKKAAPIKKK